MLTGSASATSGGYSMSLVSYQGRSRAGRAGRRGQLPEFGLVFTARCQEPEASIGVWNISIGPEPDEKPFAINIDGSFGAVPQTIAVNGCGSHELAVTLREAGSNRELA